MRKQEITMKSKAFRSALAGMATVAGGLGASVTNAQITDITPLVSGGEFELGDGDSKVIVDRSIVEAYRICVGEGAHSVALKVTANLSDTIVAAGECGTFNAQFIRITPARALEKGSVLVGRYERLKM
jgi:hypothetical protein